LSWWVNGPDRTSAEGSASVVPQSDGQIVRRSRNVRLGTVTELPTKTAARNKLADRLQNSDPSVEMDFCELSERWHAVILPTLKLTTGAHYRNALRAHVLPAFGKRKISTIGRFDVETFLSQHSKKYSRSTLRSMFRSAWLCLGLLLVDGSARIRVPELSYLAIRIVRAGELYEQFSNWRR
jgi:hypothetical protein